MAGDRLLRVLEKLSAGEETEPSTARLCEVCAEVTDMSGAGIMLMSGEAPRGSVCTTNAVSARIEDLQLTLGEGPCVDAHGQHIPVLEPDLADPVTRRWPAFSPSAVEAGARAVFGFPMHIGAVRLGALNLYRDAPGGMSDEQHADALVVADVASQTVLAMQAGAAPGTLGAELAQGTSFQLVVHQATGMVAVQLGVLVGEALVRLRAYAFANELALTRVAGAVVNRRIRFDGSEGGQLPP